jgi:hypothetical protein
MRVYRMLGQLATPQLYRRVLALGWLTVAATLGCYVWLDHIAPTSTDTKRLLMAAVLALTWLIAWSTFALAVAVLRMGRRILRAFELTTTRFGETQ